MEGAVYEHFPNFPRRVNDALKGIYGDRVDHINVGVSCNKNRKDIIILNSLYRLLVMVMVLVLL
jgi:hypothetical protein